MKYYQDASSNPNFSLIEKEIIEFWQKNKIFEQSVEKRSQDNCFVFYDGPPFANGLPHYGHLLTGFIKDAFARYQTMLGKRVERRFGWDCHGLPAEMGAEKELKISGRNEIEKFGIERFNGHCRSSVMKFASEWEKYVNRQARWVDFHNDYKTMDKSFMESVIWGFKQLYNKGLIYESVRVVPYSWACETPLSNFETKLDNAYREKVSKAVTVAFELLDKPKQFQNNICKILAWTTTPWTLPSNLALAVGKDIKYCAALVNGNQVYIFASSYFDKFANHYTNICSRVELNASDLIGLRYQPLFNYFQNTRNAFYVLAANYVTEEDGTGIVHTAPGFGEDDFHLCQNSGIPLICPIDNGGKFTTEIPDLAGINVFEANDIIIKKLKEQGNWFCTEQYIHNYPHCWRTDTPLIYRAMPSWYVAVTKLKDRMMKLNREVDWIPNHIKNGQFGKWLEGAHDWSISRNRFWGTPIPIWKSDNSKYPRIDVYGSIEELERDFNTKVEDLHRPFIDTLTRPNPDDPTGESIMRRIPDVFDCWFESGSMPFAQVHYPFENKAWFENNFPADFITEYIAQTRGWFYTLFILSTALFDKEPFKNCICHGVVLDIKGQKLSKRLNNYADPMEIFDKYGSDALRFLMLSDSIVCGGNLLLDKEGKLVRDVLKNVIKPIWNSYRFFTMYANVDGVKAEICKNYNHTIDRYMIAKCFETVERIRVFMDSYNSQGACDISVNFFEILNNWYIRRNRERFWRSNIDQDKIDAYNVLYTVFYYILRAIAPLLPLITESIWRSLKYGESSVHLAIFPELEKFDKELIGEMDLVMAVCNSALSIRNAYNIRVRQPLSNMKIYSKSFCDFLVDEYKEIIKDEVNVKNLEFISDFNQITSFELKLNFPLLGKRIPHKIKDLILYVRQGKWKQVKNKIILGDDVTIENNEYELSLKANSKYSSVFDNNRGVVVLDTFLTDELILEGIARDIVRLIQEARKQADLHISDRIKVIIKAEDKKIKSTLNEWDKYIKEQTLSLSIEYDGESSDYCCSTYENVSIYIKKINNPTDLGSNK